MLEMLKQLREQERGELKRENGDDRQPMHPRAIAAELAETFFAPKTFAPGTILKCVRQPYGQKFPKPGDLVVCVTQDKALFSKDSEPGSTRSSGDLSDIMVAIPMVMGGNDDFGIWQTHSSNFVVATEGEIDVWEPPKRGD
jgi:hypothetical protein